MMTLSEAYTENQGEPILVPGGGEGNAGQCEQWADYVLYNVDGKPYLYTPGAINWWQNPTLAAEGFTFIPFAQGVYPQVGDFVIYGTGVGSQYGHVSVCAENGNSSGFVGYDSNWEDSGVLQTITHDYTYDILGYIRLEEDVPDIFNAGDAQNVTNSLLGASTPPSWITSQIGQTYKQALENILGSPQFQDEQYINPGDIVNIADSSGWPQEQGILGWLWKRMWYDYASNKVKE